MLTGRHAQLEETLKRESVTGRFPRRKRRSLLPLRTASKKRDIRFECPLSPALLEDESNDALVANNARL